MSDLYDLSDVTELLAAMRDSRSSAVSLLQEMSAQQEGTALAKESAGCDADWFRERGGSTQKHGLSGHHRHSEEVSALILLSIAFPWWSKAEQMARRLTFCEFIDGHADTAMLCTCFSGVAKEAHCVPTPVAA